MNIATFSAMQTVKHCLNSRKMTALGYFRKGYVKHDKVDGHLCRNFKTAAAAAAAAAYGTERRSTYTCALTARESREQSPAEEVPGAGSQGEQVPGTGSQGG